MLIESQPNFFCTCIWKCFLMLTSFGFPLWLFEGDFGGFLVASKQFQLENWIVFKQWECKTIQKEILIF